MTFAGKLALLGFLFAVTGSTETWAAVAAGTSAIQAHHSPVPHLAPGGSDSLFSLPASDRGPGEIAAPSNPLAGAVNANDLLDSASGSGTQSPSEVNDAARHRNMAKFLLVILALGSLIRFLTSPAYLEFIADVLDPKAF
jgi:hypothetical protein